MSDIGFLIDGKQYPVPAIPDMDMDELQVVYEACGITLQGWAARESDDPEERREWETGVANPKWMVALLEIAYQRGNPDVPQEDVRKLVRKVKWLDATLPMLEAEEASEEEAPLAETSAPEQSLSTGQPSSDDSSSGSSQSSPNGSSQSSDGQDAEPAITGTTGSGSDPAAVPLRQVV